MNLKTYNSFIPLRVSIDKDIEEISTLRIDKDLIDLFYQNNYQKIGLVNFESIGGWVEASRKLLDLKLIFGLKLRIKNFVSNEVIIYFYPKNEKGYRSLISNYHSERNKRKLLNEDNLIKIIPLKENDIEALKKSLNYLEIRQKNDFYLGIDIDFLNLDNEKFNLIIQDKYPLVAFPKVTYKDKNSYEIIDTLLCVKRGFKYFDPNRQKADKEAFLMKNQDYYECYKIIPESIYNTNIIFHECDFSFKKDFCKKIFFLNKDDSKRRFLKLIFKGVIDKSLIDTKYFFREIYESRIIL